LGYFYDIGGAQLYLSIKHYVDIGELIISFDK
jgi:hypothetical protein